MWLNNLKEDVDKMQKRSKEYDIFSFSHTEDFHNVITSNSFSILISEKETYRENKKALKIKTKERESMDTFKSKSVPKLGQLKAVKPPKSLFVTSINADGDYVANKSRIQTLNSSMAMGEKSKLFIDTLPKTKDRLKNLQAKDFLPHLKTEIMAHTKMEIRILQKQRDSMRNQLDRISYEKLIFSSNLISVKGCQSSSKQLEPLKSLSQLTLT